MRSHCRSHPKHHRERVAIACSLIALASVAGCGNRAPREFVSGAEQRALPTDQLSAGGELCPERFYSKAERAASKRLAHAHADALVRSFKRHPEAYVHTTYASSDEGPGTEDITVRELLAQWVRFSYCAPAVQERLRAVLQSNP